MRFSSPIFMQITLEGFIGFWRLIHRKPSIYSAHSRKNLKHIYWVMEQKL